MGIKDHKRSPRPPLLDQQLERHAVVVHGVHVGRVLADLLLVLERVVRRLVRPDAVVARAPVLDGLVRRRQLQRRLREERELPPARGVDAVERRPHAVDVVRDGLPGPLLVEQEPALPEVVGADPERVDRVLGRAVREQGRLGVGARVREVGFEGRHFVVDDRGECPVDQIKVPVYNVI